MIYDQIKLKVEVPDRSQKLTLFSSEMAELLRTIDTLCNQIDWLILTARQPASDYSTPVR